MLTTATVVQILYQDKSHMKRHFKHCSRYPGIVYKFENQNLSTYEDNFRFRCDLPFIISIKYFAPDNVSCFFCDNICISSKIVPLTNNN